MTMLDRYQNRLVLLGCVAGILGAGPLHFLASVPLFAVYMRGRVDDYPLTSIVSLCVVLLFSLINGNQTSFFLFVINIFAPALALSILWLWRYADGSYIRASVIVDCIPGIAFISALLTRLCLSFMNIDAIRDVMISQTSRNGVMLNVQMVMSDVSVYDLLAVCYAICALLCAWLFSMFWLKVSDRPNKNMETGNPLLVIASVMIYFFRPSVWFLILCLMYPFMRGMIVMNNALKVQNKFVRVIILFYASFVAWICGVVDAIWTLINNLKERG